MEGNAWVLPIVEWLFEKVRDGVLADLLKSGGGNLLKFRKIADNSY